MAPNYIKQEVSIGKVPIRYKPIIKDVKSNLLKFSNKIHSIYLYGSVATGKAKSPTSDLDLVVVLKMKPTQHLTKQLKELEQKLSRKYLKTFREVGFSITYKNEVLKGRESFGWQFFLTVLSVKIWGDRLFKKGMKFSPTRKLAKNLHSDIDQNIRDAKIKITTASNEEASLQIKSIMKKLIRTSFSIVMEKENFWTTDLNDMTKIFIKYYPKKKSHIMKVLQIAKSRDPKRKEAISILDNFGRWVSSEYSKQIY